MKRYDDEEIIKKMNNENKYEIKTKADDILLAYEKSKHQVKETTKSNKKWFMFGGTGLLTLAATACVLGVVFFKTSPKDPNKPGNDNGDIQINDTFNITTNKSFSKDLITFSSLNATGETKLDALAFAKAYKDDDDDDKKDDINQTNFETIVNEYDKVERLARNVYDYESFTFKEEKVDFSYKNENYPYKVEIIFKGESLSTFYYSEKTLKDTNPNYIEGLFTEDNKNFFNVKAEVENEVEEGETEKEIKAIFTNETTKIVVEKENEVEGQEVENSYSYKEYALNSSTPRYELVYEYENENSEEELLIEVKENSKTYEFEKIKKIDETHFTFIPSKIENNEYDAVFSLEYKVDSKIYTYNNFKLTK